MISAEYRYFEVWGVMPENRVAPLKNESLSHVWL